MKVRVNVNAVRNTAKVGLNSHRNVMQNSLQNNWTINKSEDDDEHLGMMKSGISSKCSTSSSSIVHAIV